VYPKSAEADDLCSFAGRRRIIPYQRLYGRNHLLSIKLPRIPPHKGLDFLSSIVTSITYISLTLIHLSSLFIPFQMKIIEKIEQAQKSKHIAYSFEYFPPKTELVIHI
jgi:hypothetical protein